MMTFEEIATAIRNLSVQERKKLITLIVDSLAEDNPQRTRSILEFDGIGERLRDGTEAQDPVDRLGSEWDKRETGRKPIWNIPVYDQFVEFITSLPTLAEIMAYTMPLQAQARLRDLLDANHNRRLSDTENMVLDKYEQLGRLIRRAKT